MRAQLSQVTIGIDPGDASRPIHTLLEHGREGEMRMIAYEGAGGTNPYSDGASGITEADPPTIAEELPLWIRHDERLRAGISTCTIQHLVGAIADGSIRDTWRGSVGRRDGPDDIEASD